MLFPQFRILGINHFDNIVIVLGSVKKESRGMDKDLYEQLTALCEKR